MLKNDLEESGEEKLNTFQQEVISQLSHKSGLARSWKAEFEPT